MPRRGDQSFQVTPDRRPGNSSAGSICGANGCAGTLAASASSFWLSQRTPRFNVSRLSVKLSCA